MILGIDEVGRGAWAGPMAVGAVVLGDRAINGLNDSKKLSPKKRAELALEIKRHARAIGIGWVSAAAIDKLGLGSALKLAARRAVAQIDCDFDEIIIDGTIRLIDDPRVSTLPRADGLIAAVSAASIVAKVARDNYMAQLDKVFDGYNFAGNVGYGTAGHRAAIATSGVLPIHRQSFAPIAEFTSRANPGECRGKIATTAGRIAEDTAAKYLVQNGHEIIAQNWKTKVCEIDIISSRGDTIYFTEVKYRNNDKFGDGFDAITKQKERQMRFAAEIWLSNQNLFSKVNARLSVVALSGRPPVVTGYIEDVDRC